MEEAFVLDLRVLELTQVTGSFLSMLPMTVAGWYLDWVPHQVRILIIITLVGLSKAKCTRDCHLRVIQSYNLAFLEGLGKFQAHLSIQFQLTVIQMHLVTQTK